MIGAPQRCIASVAGRRMITTELFPASQVPLVSGSLTARSAYSTQASAQKSLTGHIRGPSSSRTSLFCAGRPSNSGTCARIRYPPGTPRSSYATETIMAGEPAIHDVFESVTGTWQYVVADPSTLSAVIIDPVLDYSPTDQVITTASADALLDLVKKNGYKVERILETHAHADHLTAASYLQKRLAQEQDHKPLICIGKRIKGIQELFGQRYGVPFEECERVFDKFFGDDEIFHIGKLEATAVHLPGHTPDHLGYKIGDNVFCGDSIFHADIGTARCDFPGGDARRLYASARRLLAMPGHVRIWTGHDYPAGGREPRPWMRVADHRQLNRHLHDGVTEDEFVALRTTRDAALAAPRLLHQSLQMNIRAARPPKPTPGGDRMLHLPLKLQGAEW